MQTKLIRLYAVIITIVLISLISSCTISLQTPKIELNTNSFDLGEIYPDEGIRTETFFIKNTGNAVLEIKGISTSCGCTEAKAASNEIAPGEQTTLTVAYDPSVHPGLTGKIQRIVYVKSNDPSNKEVELELIGNSLPSKIE